MPLPTPCPPLRTGSKEARNTISRRRTQGAELFTADRRYTREMHERFENWFQDTAQDLERLYWAPDVANWFRQGNGWLVGAGSYQGILDTWNDRLKLLDELLTTFAVDATCVSDGEQYDVCLSFAGEQRSYVENVARALADAGISVFYDRDEEIDLWGKNLYEHLNSVYRDRSRFCVIFVSREYAAKNWPSHERQSAQARAIRENREYILPARFDDTQLPGMNDTVQYADLRRISPQQLADMIVKKVGRLDALGSHSPTAPKNVARGSFLSSEAETLLSEAAATALGVIQRLAFDLGVDIRANGKSFVEEGNSKSAAIWDAALQELERNSFVSPVGLGRFEFQLTRAGYDYAERLAK